MRPCKVIRVPMKRLFPLLLVVSALLIASCGYKGPLVMPEAAPQPAAEPEQEKNKKAP